MSDGKDGLIRKTLIALVLLNITIVTASCADNSGNLLNKKDSTKTNGTVTAGNDSLTTTHNHIESTPIVYDSTKRYFYLTFDDGPQPPGSHHCFDIFRALGVKGTFFMIANHVISKDRKALVDSIRESYPQYLLANHSQSHAFGDHYIYFYHHPEEAAQDFYRCQKILNIPFKIARLPGNSAWVRKNDLRASNLVKPVCEVLDSAGYNVIGWDVEWMFKNHGGSIPIQSTEQMLQQVYAAFDKNHSHVKNHVVLLAHDRMFDKPDYADSLYKFIQKLKEDPRIVFETIDHYPGLKHDN
jgi:peptidoglycan/xylan/chitin deacetylase (PgdA/CDA1 family)